MTIIVKLVSKPHEIEQVRALCRQWLEWHWDNYPDDWPTDGNPMDRAQFGTILDSLAEIHARPNGGIFLASLDGQPVGCVMYNKAGDGVTEFNRMFVTEAGRGHGIGHLLLGQMFEQMIKDGYRKVMFSSAIFLTHAKAMYEAAGFKSAPHPEGFPTEWKPYVYFMERSLTT